MTMMMASCMTSPVIEVVVLSDKDLVLGGSTVPIYKKFDDAKADSMPIVTIPTDTATAMFLAGLLTGFEWKNGLSVMVGDDGGDGGCGGGDDVTGNNGWWSILRIAGNGPSLDSKLFPGLLDSNSLRSS
ncbi:hypothetical protein Tco_0963694 [Tanacetum coccineum]